MDNVYRMNTEGGRNKIYTGPKNGKYVIVIKDGKRIKKYITKQQ